MAIRKLESIIEANADSARAILEGEMIIHKFELGQSAVTLVGSLEAR